MESKVKVLKNLEKSTYKFTTIVEDLLESKIRWLCEKFPHNEWSGILFYETEGKLADGSLKVYCKDMHLMDYGSATFTEYYEDGSMIKYMDDHDLLLCNIGIIHSHNTMAAFFSGTDTNTLKQEGNDKDNFFSLIVNNAGKYCSGITVKMTDEIRSSTNDFYFTDFDGRKSVYKTEPYSYSDWLVYWAEGEISIETPTHTVDYTDRIEEIKAEKEKKGNRCTYATGSYPYQSNYSGSYGPLFEHNYSYRRDYLDQGFNDHSEWLARKHFEYANENDLYEDKFLQLLTMSIFTNHNSKLNLATFIRMLPKMVETRFGSESMYFNALESFTDLVFDDCVVEDVIKTCEYILNKTKLFKTNTAFESFIGWVTYYLSMLKEDEEIDEKYISKVEDEDDRDRVFPTEDPYHWSTNGK